MDGQLGQQVGHGQQQRAHQANQVGGIRSDRPLQQQGGKRTPPACACAVRSRPGLKPPQQVWPLVFVVPTGLFCEGCVCVLRSRPAAASVAVFAFSWFSVCSPYTLPALDLPLQSVSLSAMHYCKSSSHKLSGASAPPSSLSVGLDSQQHVRVYFLT